MNRCTTLPSPVGDLLISGDERAVTGLWMGRCVPSGWSRDDAALARVRAELEEYFAGARRAFGVPVDPAGTQWQRRVWAELQRIPYGETISYGELARRLGAPAASRAVGAANGRNPVSILIPCHRVVGADGTLTGYGGGLERKRALLDLERGVRALV